MKNYVNGKQCQPDVSDGGGVAKYDYKEVAKRVLCGGGFVVP